MKILDIKEHQEIEYNQEDIVIFNKNKRILDEFGIKVNDKLKVGYFIGLFLFGNIAIKIHPKFNDDNIKIDIITMMKECLNHPIVSKYLSGCYKIYYDLPPINTDIDLCSELYIFIIHRYVTILKETLKHGLYKSFYKEENVLKGKVKGKLLIKDTLNIHLKENVKLKNQCKYETHDINNIENQILKYALKKAEVFSLSDKKYQSIYRDICIIKEKFNNVDSKIINNADFKKINKRIINKGYKESLRLAYEVIKILDGNIYGKGKINNIYPFYINMPELFERYCEVKLRIPFPLLKVGYKKGDKDSQTATKAQRPDFIIPKDCKTEPYILDSKYSIKYIDIEKQNDTDELIKEKIGKIKEHLQQLSLYARTKGIQSRAKAENSSEIKLCILYPVINEEHTEYDFKNMIKEGGIEDKYLSKNIENFYYLPVKLPIISNDKKG